MTHGNDGYDRRPAADATAEATKAAGSARQANGDWVLVNCGPCGVRPRRQLGRWPLNKAPDARD